MILFTFFFYFDNRAAMSFLAGRGHTTVFFPRRVVQATQAHNRKLKTRRRQQHETSFSLLLSSSLPLSPWAAEQHWEENLKFD